MSKPAVSAGPAAPAALLRFAQDELQRMPLAWTRLNQELALAAQRSYATATMAQRFEQEDLLRLAHSHASAMGAAYLAVLKAQLQRLMEGPAAMAAAAAAALAGPAAPRRAGGRVVLELVDDEVIALDVALSHTVQAIQGASEDELRDLQGYLAAMVADHDVAEDHTPFPPAVHARALRAAVQVLPVDLAQRLAFIRAATPVLARLLNESYAAACARLAERGLEPAQHRSVVSNVDHRWRFIPAAAPLPDLQLMREAMPQAPISYAWAGGPGGGVAASLVPGAFPGGGHSGGPGAAAGGAPGPMGPAGVGHPSMQAALQTVELVDRLFRAMARDERVPGDVGSLIAGLRESAMRLALHDPSVLDRSEHPIWRLIHLFAYQAEMVPDRGDAERQRWLEFGQRMFEELSAATMQKGNSYRTAATRLEEFLERRLARRVDSLANRLRALQCTEAGLASGRGEEDSGAADTQSGIEQIHDTLQWYEALLPGQWLRLVLDGSWVHAQLLWRGDQRQILLLGDGASKVTWAVRRTVLTKMHRHGLAKTLKMRSLVGTAALRLQEEVALGAAA